jgi:CHAD domain-containing protein
VAEITKTGAIGRQSIRCQTVRDPRSGVRIPTPASVHAARRASRRTLVRLRALRPALGRSAFFRLRRSLHSLVDVTAESRDAEVQLRIVLQLKAALPQGRERECDPLLMKLGSRRRAANARLAKYLGAEVGSEQMRRISKDLSALQVAQSSADLSGLASRRYGRALRELEQLLTREPSTGRRVHPLRIAVHLMRKLNKKQVALGDLHDLMLLLRWIQDRGLTLPPLLRSALDSAAQSCLKRCEGHRKPLRHAIRRFLRRTRQ